MKIFKHIPAILCAVSILFLIIVSYAQPSSGRFSHVSTFDTSYLLALLFVIIAILITFAVIIFKERRNYKEHAYKLENIDLLTGERNLFCFIKEAGDILFKNKRSEYTVMQINIRNFKYINDIFSTFEGDKLIKNMAENISKLLTPGEIQARTNADNFIILLHRTEFEQLHIFFNELKVLVRKSCGVTLDDIMGEIYCGICILEDNTDINDAVESAHIALRVAAEKKISSALYDEQMRSDALKESEIVKSMYDAMREEEFCFYLQPQHYLLEQDKIMSAEALVRWRKPDGSIVSPGEFIPIFERNGFIIELDRYIFEQVCKFISYYINEDWFENLRIAVNVSRIDIYKRDFVEFYKQTKNKYNIPDGRLELEFTESVAFEDYETFQRTIHTLKANGFYCSLDDFGSGSSSLNVLKELPVDALKMDRKFFIGSKGNLKRNNSLIASVIAMARGLDMEIVAEGIEDEEQIEFLRKIGCGVVQGFVYSKPLCVSDFIEYAKTYRGFNKTFDLDSSLCAANESLKFMPQKPGIDDVYLKYLSTLKNTEMMVWEIDLRHDKMRVVSTGGGRFYHKNAAGRFSAEICSFMDSQVNPEDRQDFFKTVSFDNIMLSFERGDEEVSHEYSGMVYDDKMLCLKEEYQRYILTFCRIGNAKEKPTMALAFFRRAEARKGEPVKLSLALKNLSGTIYEVNIKSQQMQLIQNNSLNGNIAKDTNMESKVMTFYNKYIHPDDIDTLIMWSSTEGLNSFKHSPSEITRCEFRKKGFGDVYEWYCSTIIKNNADSDLFLILTQKM
ncbi:MAG: GGDEF domain-containing phosphodiesterase [Eubacterium sp.]|jgi:diguanylate cyclase (GGDEF)-like protein|nr:GGDEF domain-containing phosphodiesterase [Eubacterium sp.]